MMLLDRSNHDEEFAAGFTEFGVTVKKIRLSEVQGLICKTQGLNRKRNNCKQALGHVAARGWPSSVRCGSYTANGH